MPLKRIPSKPRYNYVKKIACETLIKYNIKTLPIDIDTIISNTSNLRLLTYSCYAKELNINMSQAIEKLKTEDGLIQYYPDADFYLIIYNENIYTHGRVRWTLAHELGHLFLNHALDFDKTEILRGGLNNDEYQVLEGEAHFYAKFLLSVPVVANSIGIKSHIHIQNIFDITNKAAIGCYNYLHNYWQRIGASYHEKKVLETFKEYINRKEYYKFLYNFCPTCKNYIINNDKFCSICGTEYPFKFDKEKLNMIYNNEYELDKNSKAIMCPVCSSEERVDGDYCHICGTKIVNKCQNLECGRLLGGNARYCSHCGTQSTFYSEGLLKAWDEVIYEEDDYCANNGFSPVDFPF